VIDAIGKKMQALAGIGEKITQSLTTAFKGASVSVMGLATAGLAGTVEGNRMTFAWQQLSRQITAVALPGFEKITHVVAAITDRFRALSGVQQANLLRWAAMVGLGGGIVMMASGVGTVTGAFVTMASAVALAGDRVDTLVSRLEKLADNKWVQMLGKYLYNTS